MAIRISFAAGKLQIITQLKAVVVYEVACHKQHDVLKPRSRFYTQYSTGTYTQTNAFPEL